MLSSLGEEGMPFMEDDDSTFCAYGQS
jgi:hypothetical protein